MHGHDASRAMSNPIDSVVYIFNIACMMFYMKDLPMTFHEKTRWVSLFANLIIWGWYFVSFLSDWSRGLATGQNAFGGMVLAVIGCVVIQVVAVTVLAIHRPGEANLALDERERAIGQRASAIAYSVLGFGIVVIVIAAYLAIDYLLAMNLLMLWFIGVECLRYAVEILSYRRGIA